MSVYFTFYSYGQTLKTYCTTYFSLMKESDDLEKLSGGGGLCNHGALFM